MLIESIMANDKPTNLDKLRARANDSARAILDRIWDHYCHRHEPIRDLSLYSKSKSEGGKQAVLSALAPLGGKVVYSMLQGGKENYYLHLLGILVSSRGAEAEALLVKYLEYARERYQSDADDTRITSAQLEKRFGLSQEQLRFLERLLPMAPFGGSVQSTTNPNDPWYIELPAVIADAPHDGDLRGFFDDQVMANFDTNVPVTETERSLYYATHQSAPDSQLFWRGKPIPPATLSSSKSIGEGTIIETTFGRYTMGQLIGEGGAGRVFEAVDEVGEKCAIKLLDPLKAKGDKRRRFQNEIQFGIRNEHKNIIRIKDYGLYTDGKGDSPFYVMPLYKSTLRKLMNAGIPKQKALQYFTQLLDGVEAAHLLGTFHRDLKPENVLYDPAPDCLVVADFGIARFNQEELYTFVETRAEDRLANFQYAAPEQRHRGRAVDHRVDIYALGLILNELFTGEIPLGSGHRTIAAVVVEYAYLDELVEKMRQQDADARPSSIGQIKQELMARGQDFVIQQRLSQLRQTVIPESDVNDDPLIRDPMRLIGFDYEEPNVLILKLSNPINDGWAHALRNMGSHSAVYGKGPDQFQLRGNTARISASEHEIQDIIGYFKEWLPQANRVYKETLIAEKREREQKQRRKAQDEISRVEQIQRIRKNIKI